MRLVDEIGNYKDVLPRDFPNCEFEWIDPLHSLTKRMKAQIGQLKTDLQFHQMHEY